MTRLEREGDLKIGGLEVQYCCAAHERWYADDSRGWYLVYILVVYSRKGRHFLHGACQQSEVLLRRRSVSLEVVGTVAPP
jgi:hypothetical protein